jgi:hypothetical protein
MNYLVPSQMSARRQTIGRTEYIVISTFCGEETIIKKLEHLMQTDFRETLTAEKNLPKALDKQQP